MIPRFFRATHLASGNWLVWLYVDKEEPQWDSARRVYILDDLKAKIVNGN